jgi:hypothetical protein
MLRKAMIVLAMPTALTGGLTVEAFEHGGGTGHGGGFGGDGRTGVSGSRKFFDIDESTGFFRCMRLSSISDGRSVH